MLFRIDKHLSSSKITMMAMAMLIESDTFFICKYSHDMQCKLLLVCMHAILSKTQILNDEISNEKSLSSKTVWIKSLEKCVLWFVETYAGIDIIVQLKIQIEILLFDFKGPRFARGLDRFFNRRSFIQIQIHKSHNHLVRMRISSLRNGRIRCHHLFYGISISVQLQAKQKKIKINSTKWSINSKINSNL